VSPLDDTRELEPAPKRAFYTTAGTLRQRLGVWAAGLPGRDL